MKPTLTYSVLSKTHTCSMTAACIYSALSSPKIHELVHPNHTLSMGSSDLPKARSTQLTKWYLQAKPGDIFMFIDADQIFTTDDIILGLKYLETNDVVCGTYPKSNGDLASVPYDMTSFYNNLGGKLIYGATGFMFITYDIADRLVKHFGKTYESSSDVQIYPFFYELLVEEPEIKEGEMWLSEDYSFCYQVRKIGGSIYGYITPTIGHIITEHKFVTIPESYKWNDNTIVYYCSNTSEPWSADSLKQGIGGSETAVIKLTQYWANKGYEVYVYCNCDKPGKHNNVTYYSYKDFNINDQFDTLIIWRNLQLLKLVNLNCKQLYVDLHDLTNSSQINDRAINQITNVCFKSQYHRSLLPNLPDEKAMIIPNGGYVETEEKVERDPNYLIYTSSYDRGLIYMLKWGWPVIKKACPNAYLKIYYGWNLFDKMQPKTEEVAVYKREMNRLMSQDGVEECGRVSNEVILKEKAKANIHWYTGNFQEIDCISVRESASLGAIPVVSSYQKVFNEKPYCICVDGNPTTEEMQISGAKKVIELLTNSELCKKTRRKMRLSSEESWNAVAEKWINMFSKNKNKN